MGAASGRLDAGIFMVGLVLGIFAFAEIYPAIYEFAWSGDMGALTLPDLFGLPSYAVAIGAAAMALVLFRLAAVAERRFRRS